MSEDEERTRAEDFVVYPLHNLIAVFHGVDSLNVAMNDLKENGFARDDMRSFIGQEGIQGMDFAGSAHGRVSELLRSLQHIGPDRTYLERYEKYMQDGDCILMVHAPQTERKEIAAEIMRKHSAHRITYFGTFVIEEV